MVTGLWGVDTRIWFCGLLGLVVVERLVELSISQRNERRLRRQGAIEVGREQYRWMVLAHTLFLICCPLEVWLLNRPFVPALALSSLVLLVGAMALRYWVIGTLGQRWTTRVLCLPGERVIQTGPYRWLRHPNYLAVVIEVIALPMVHTAWLSALTFSALNGWVLQVRIRTEEQGLNHTSEYLETLGDRPRLVPLLIPRRRP